MELPRKSVCVINSAEMLDVDVLTEDFCGCH
jgi:hypothetical protein